MRLSAPIYHLKRQAKAHARIANIPLHRALDSIAQTEGYQTWSHLASSYEKQNPVHRVYAALQPGDVMLLAARPRQGKTLLGLELAIEAYRDGNSSTFFTLDYTQEDVRACFTSLGVADALAQQAVSIDTSDEICADYIAAHLSRQEGTSFAVVDYLQLLDQKRSDPPLGDQLCTLAKCARATGAIVVLLAQIDRTFDAAARELPDWSDLRLPNPVDLAPVRKACFLHEGHMVMRFAA